MARASKFLDLLKGAKDTVKNTAGRVSRRVSKARQTASNNRRLSKRDRMFRENLDHLRNSYSTGMRKSSTLGLREGASRVASNVGRKVSSTASRARSKVNSIREQRRETRGLRSSIRTVKKRAYQAKARNALSAVGRKGKAFGGMVAEGARRVKSKARSARDSIKGRMPRKRAKSAGAIAAERRKAQRRGR